MVQRSQWFLLLLALLFLHAASSDAIPLTRGFKLFHDAEANSLHDIQEILVAGDESVEGSSGRRMDLETLDYAGTGANGGHIPRPRP